MFLQHTHALYFDSIRLLEILTRAPNVDQSAAENSSQQMHRLDKKSVERAPEGSVQGPLKEREPALGPHQEAEQCLCVEDAPVDELSSCLAHVLSNLQRLVPPEVVLPASSCTCLKCVACVCRGGRRRVVLCHSTANKQFYCLRDQRAVNAAPETSWQPVDLLFTPLLTCDSD